MYGSMGEGGRDKANKKSMNEQDTGLRRIDKQNTGETVKAGEGRREVEKA